MALVTDQFVHPSDKAALDKLEAIPGFPMLVKKIMNIGLETYMYGVNMASAIRLSEKQLPEIYRHLPPICAKLGIPEPELYLQMDPMPNAWTFGDTRIFITVTSGLVESMTDEELDAVLAHECGHILCRHVLYHTVAHVLNFGASLLGPVASLVTSAVQYALLYWSRMSELSADRVSALVTSPEVVASTMARLSGGPKSITQNINFEEWGKQAYEYDRICNDGAWNNVLQKLAIMDSDHPFSAVRVREIMLWCQGPEFAAARAHLDALPGGAVPRLPGRPAQLPQPEPPQPPAGPEQGNGRGGLLGNLGNLGNLGMQGGMAEAKKMADKLGGLGGRLLSRKQPPVSAIGISRGETAEIDARQLVVGLGWQSPVANLDMDASAFLLGTDGKVAGNGDFIFFNNLQHSSGSVRHLGNELEIRGTDDKVQLVVDCSQVPQGISRIAIALTIYDGENRGQSFSQISKVYLRVADRTSGTELVRYTLENSNGGESVVIMGELQGDGSGWKFAAQGQECSGGLRGLVQRFGVRV